MKYIKLYEDIDWDWVDEENEPVSDKFNKVEEKILKKEFPVIVRIHKKYDYEFIKLLDKYSIPNIGKEEYYNEIGIVYFYIQFKDIGYMRDNDYTIRYNKENYPNIEIIEII